MLPIVYAFSGAPRPWRVLAGLAFKGVDYELRYLEASKGEHKAPGFLALNSRGTVPVLVAGDLVLNDSIGILAWLDRQYPDNPLFGKTPQEAALIWKIALESSDYLRRAQHDVFFSILVQGKPVPDATTAEGRAARKAAEVLRSELKRLEDLLDEDGFLSGNTPTAADAICFPEIQLIKRALDTKPTELIELGLSNVASDYPKLNAWMTRVEALPGMEKTKPPHWTSQ